MNAPERLFIPPVRDFIFKPIFGDVNTLDITTSFLQSVLDLPPDEYQGIEITDPNIQRDFIRDKLNIVDIKLHTKTGGIINVEIQSHNTYEIRERMLYTLAKVFSSQLHSGESYRALKRVISIQITDFNLLTEEEEPAEFYHNRYLFKNDRSGKAFSRIVEAHLLELPKAPKVMGNGTMLENWLGFIGAKSEEEIEMVEKSNPIIGKAVGRYRVLSGEERAQELERLRINEEQLKGELIHDAVEKGIKLGEGRSAATIAQYQAQLSAKDAQLSAKDAELAALKQQLAQARR